MSARLMSRIVIAAVAAVLAAGTAAGCFSEHVAPQSTGIDARAICADPGSAAANVVIIKDFAFQPATVHIAAGQQVVWVNCETTAGLGHTSTSDASGWNSGLIDPLASYSRTFASAGTFPYHCAIHPEMLASVEVQ